MDKPRGIRTEQWEKLQVVQREFEQFMNTPVVIELPTLSQRLESVILSVDHQKITDSPWKDSENGRGKQQFAITVGDPLEEEENGNIFVVTLEDIQIEKCGNSLLLRNNNGLLMSIEQKG